MNTENQTPNGSSESSENISRRKSLLYLAIIGFITAGILIGVYLYMIRDRIYAENSLISAPEIALSSQGGGILERIFVNPGDALSENEVVAQVGQELVKSKEAGIAISVNDNVGKTFSPGEAVVTMIKPEDLRVVAKVEEDKGLSNIQIGQRVAFTVDAYGAKEFSGIVDEVSPTSREGDVVFNISSQRQENEFNVKIRFDESAYPQLKNGMSAKAWIYKD